jgi:methylated-DNA-[protein]-cysteine S-methyltransferase
MQTVTFDSELGWLCAAFRGELLHELTFGHDSPQAAVRALRHSAGAPTAAPSRSLRRLQERLQAFAEDPQDDFLDVRLAVDEFTEFQRKVLQQCRNVHIGETITYAELAERAGRPRAARAVGQVMAHNRFPLIVPCHRVVASNGSLGGYSARHGLNMKRRLLALESRTLAVRL